MNTKATHHDWESRVGQAPYSLRCCLSIPSAESFGMNIAGYQNALAECFDGARQFGVSLGSCEVCGTGINHNFVCRNAAGAHFVVGSDCVAKLGDTRLTTEVEELERSRQRRLARARREAQWRREAEARLSKEREENGGLTRYEIEQRKRDEQLKAAEARAAQAAIENQWLIGVLRRVPSNGAFIPDMIDKLHREPLADLWPRAINVLREIYAKAHGRRRSAEYRDAMDRFDEHLAAART